MEFRDIAGGIILIIVVIGFILHFATYFMEAPRPYIEYSHSKIITWNQIEADEHRLVINVDDALVGMTHNTGSMRPILDKNSIYIKQPVAEENNINLYDIVEYQNGNGRIIHQVIEIGRDGNGWYCRTKGINNKEADKKIVRFNQIKYRVIGVLF